MRLNASHKARGKGRKGRKGGGKGGRRRFGAKGKGHRRRFTRRRYWTEDGFWYDHEEDYALEDCDVGYGMNFGTTDQ